MSVNVISHFLTFTHFIYTSQSIFFGWYNGLRWYQSPWNGLLPSACCLAKVLWTGQTKNYILSVRACFHACLVHHFLFKWMRAAYCLSECNVCPLILVRTLPLCQKSCPLSSLLKFSKCAEFRRFPFRKETNWCRNKNY